MIYIVWIIHWRSLSIHWEQKAGETRETHILGLELTPENTGAQMPRLGKQDKQSTISQWMLAKSGCVTRAFPLEMVLPYCPEKLSSAQPKDHLLVLLQTPAEPILFSVELHVSWVAILLYTWVQEERK